MRKPYGLALFVGLAVAALAAPGALAAEGKYALTTATQAEYAKGDTAVILGYDFEASRELIIQITRPDGTIEDARGRKGFADKIVTDSIGQFGYEYPRLDLTGLYRVDVLDAATATRGKVKFSGVVLASTVFKDNITTDLELVGMPLAQCGPNRPPAHGSSPPTPSVGHDGLVDALAGRCLVGTVDIRNTDAGATIQGFQFSLSPALLSGLQGGGQRPFIDNLETIDIGNTADADTGNAPADDGQGGCPDNCFYTTAGNVDIPKAGVFNLTSLDGTQFSIEFVGTHDHGPTVEEDYLVTVLSDVSAARFEYCARINPEAGDADNGNDGWIDSSPATGGEEVSPINVCRTEQTPPVCVVTLDGDCGFDAFIQDAGSGVSKITVLEATNNALLFDNPPGATPGQGDMVTYAPPTTDPINVHGTKIDCSQFAQTVLEIVAGSGLVTVCDPVDFTLVRDKGTPVANKFGLLEREGLLFINNHGLRDIWMDLNGNKLHFSTSQATEANAYSMSENGESRFDLREFLLSGDNNIEIQAVGAPGGRARIVLHD